MVARLRSGVAVNYLGHWFTVLHITIGNNKWFSVYVFALGFV